MVVQIQVDSDNVCRWSSGHRLVFDNRADGVTAAAVARALGRLGRATPGRGL
ncbi:hypothetical protein SBI_01585 [Streptomyces bingchenggensis BCW-1]|uniref:Uncharacterized protein n=1 Tax=Streptomyces bingchenggensis (strain BCW-1) TaxID=749414 RepID=D7CFH0_STRBB|nr:MULTISPECIES: hypothetical protein [Streptomyces]ADI04706.1 hypothetical protein SBI_01585 [Streptomyces bingchenggensis BCW-1]